jgi:tetratricopeptide (TPR) repeat protein
MSLEDLAKGVCSPSYLSLIETGHRPLTSKIWTQLEPVLGGHLADQVLASSVAVFAGIKSAVLLGIVPGDSALFTLEPWLSSRLQACIQHELEGELTKALSCYREICDLATSSWPDWQQQCNFAPWSVRLHVFCAEQLVRLEADTYSITRAIEVAEDTVSRYMAEEATADEVRSLRSLLCGLYSEIGDSERADRLSIELSSTGKTDSERAMALWLRGQILMDSGKFLEGAFVLNNASQLLDIRVASATGFRLQNSALWAQCLADTQLSETGLEDISAAVNFFRSSGNIPDLATCLNTMAFVSYRLGYVDLSSDCNQNSALFLKDLEGARKASLLAGLALVETMLQNFDPAFEYLKQASTLLERSDFGRKSAVVWAQLSEIYEKLGDTKSSLTCLKASLASIGITGAPLELGSSNLRFIK